MTDIVTTLTPAVVTETAAEIATPVTAGDTHTMPDPEPGPIPAAPAEGSTVQIGETFPAVSLGGAIGAEIAAEGVGAALLDTPVADISSTATALGFDANLETASGTNF